MNENSHDVQEGQDMPRVYLPRICVDYKRENSETILEKVNCPWLIEIALQKDKEKRILSEI